MSDFKKQYLEKKNAIIDCLASAEKFLSEHDYVHEAEMITAQRENLENGEFSIAVVGEFSAGKSTFLNALMGEKILPSFTKETTATINFLRHKDKAEGEESGKVYYNDGHQDSIQTADFSTISKYVSTESTTVDVAKTISHLDLYLDSKFLEGNVTLVDTPGLNGIAEGHRELTEEQIEKSSASIFLFDANQPGSRSDFEFLTELRKRVKSIIFVLNKIDSIKSTEGESVETVIEKLKENYKLVYPDAETMPEIWPIAAYPALVARGSAKMDFRGKSEFTKEEKVEFEELSRMKAFEERLWKFLTQGEKARNELLAPITQLIAQLEEIYRARKTELDTLSGELDSGEIEEQQLELNKHLADLEEQLNEKTKGIKKDLREAQRDFFDAVNSDCERCKQRYNHLIDNFVDLDDIDSQNIENRVKKDFLKIGESAYLDYCEAVQSIQANYANSITDELNETLSGALNVKLDQKLELPEYTVGLGDFDNKVDELKAEINRLREETDKSDDDWARAMELSAKKETLERKLEAKQEARTFYEENSMTCIPDTRIRTESESVAVSRGGIFGGLVDFFLGSKHEMRPVEVCDSQERDAYLQNRQKILERRDKEIEALQTQLDSIPASDVKAAERIAHRKAEALSEKRAELIAYQEAFSEKIRRQGERQLKHQKDEINNYIDTLSGDFVAQCKASFRENRDAQVNVMTELIGGSIARQIELKKQELDLLVEKSNMAVSERNERINRINEEQSEVKSFLSAALDIQSDIESMKVDVIAEEEL